MKLSKILQKLQVRSYDTGITDSTIQLAQELEAMTQWQSIESAPRDGTCVDLWLTYQINQDDGYRVPDAWFQDGQWHYNFCDEDCKLDDTDCKIIYWRLVTKPPQAD